MKLRLKKKKSFFIIIPGFGETGAERPYQHIARNARTCGFEVICMHIRWERTTIADWLKSLQKTLEKLNTGARRSVILGFSFGALIAVLGASRQKFKKLILCSLSPYFKDDLRYLPKAARTFIGKKRYAAFAHYPFPTDAAVPVVFLMGEKDWPLARRRAQVHYRSWRGRKRYVVVKDAEHDLANQNYLFEIEKCMKNKCLKG